MSCPLCGLPSDQNCKHYVLAVDVTFNEIVGGELYSEACEFESAFEDALRRAAATGTDVPDDMPGPEYEIKEILAAVRENIGDEPVSDPSYIDVKALIPHQFMDLLYGSIIGEDILIYEEDGEFEGGPGTSSAYRIFYCSDPPEFRKKLLHWTKLLQA